MTLPLAGQESISDRGDRLVALTLEHVEDTMAGQAELGAKAHSYGEQIAHLTELRNEALRGCGQEEAFLATAFARSRYMLWAEQDRSNGYIADSDVLANAVRLSPPGDVLEHDSAREERVRHLGAFSSLVVAGRPTLVAWMETAHSMFSAGVSEHDGLSLRLNGTEYNRNEFLLGLGNRTPIRLGRIVFSRGEAFNAAVHSGEEAAEHLRGAVVSHVASFDAQEERLEGSVSLETRYQAQDQKEQIMTGLVSAVHAAQELGITDLVESDKLSYVLDLLSVHLFKTGSKIGSRSTDVNLIAEAIRYLYPDDAEKSVVDYLIAGSYKESKQTHGRHHWSPVVSVLHDVFDVPLSHQHDVEHNIVGRLNY